MEHNNLAQNNLLSLLDSCVIGLSIAFTLKRTPDVYASIKKLKQNIMGLTDKLEQLGTDDYLQELIKGYRQIAIEIK